MSQKESRFGARLRRVHQSRTHALEAQKSNTGSRVFLAEEVVETSTLSGEEAPGEQLESCADHSSAWRSFGAAVQDGVAVLQRTFPAYHVHGTSRLDPERLRRAWSLEAQSMLLPPSRELDSVAFLDIETCGLSSEDLIFCVGIGAWREGLFSIVQLVPLVAEREAELVEKVAEELAGIETLCTFNGKTFDLPRLQSCARRHRRALSLGSRESVDLFRLLSSEPQSGGLAWAERELLGFSRQDDTSGKEAPRVWSQYLRQGDPACLEGILHHNRLDILSLPLIWSTLLEGKTQPGKGRVEPAPRAEASPPRGRVHQQLARTYQLRQRSKKRRRDRAAALEHESERDRGFTRKARGIEQRVRVLRARVQEALDVGASLESHRQDILELVALCPDHPFGLEQLAALYEQSGQEGLRDEIKARLRAILPYL